MKLWPQFFAAQMINASFFDFNGLFQEILEKLPKNFDFDHFDWGLLQRSCYLILEIETYRFPVCSFVFVFIILNDILRFIKIQYWFVNHYIFITKNINKLQKIVGWNLPLNFGATFQLIFAPEVISDKKKQNFHLQSWPIFSNISFQVLCSCLLRESFVKNI